MAVCTDEGCVCTCVNDVAVSQTCVGVCGCMCIIHLSYP